MADDDYSLGSDNGSVDTAAALRIRTVKRKSTIEVDAEEIPHVQNTSGNGSIGSTKRKLSLEAIRQDEIKRENIENALNQFILQAGNIYKGNNLSDDDATKLRDAASDAGICVKVVDALLQQTADKKAMFANYAASDDVFARKIKADPQFSRGTLEKSPKNAENGADGLNVSNSIWRIFLHKIIKQFLKEQNMQLSDIIDKSANTRKIYEDALRCNPGDGKRNNSKGPRDYTEERKHVVITKADAKLARMEASEAMIRYQQSKNLSAYDLVKGASVQHRHEVVKPKNKNVVRRRTFKMPVPPGEKYQESRDDDDNDDLSMVPCSNGREDTINHRSLGSGDPNDMVWLVDDDFTEAEFPKDHKDTMPKQDESKAQEERGSSCYDPKSGRCSNHRDYSMMEEEAHPRSENVETLQTPDDLNSAKSYSRDSELKNSQLLVSQSQDQKDQTSETPLVRSSLSTTPKSMSQPPRDMHEIKMSRTPPEKQNPSEDVKKRIAMFEHGVKSPQIKSMSSQSSDRISEQDLTKRRKILQARAIFEKNDEPISSHATTQSERQNKNIQRVLATWTEKEEGKIASVSIEGEKMKNVCDDWEAKENAETTANDTVGLKPVSSVQNIRDKWVQKEKGHSKPQVENSQKTGQVGKIQIGSIQMARGRWIQKEENNAPVLMDNGANHSKNEIGKTLQDEGEENRYDSCSEDQEKTEIPIADQKSERSRPQVPMVNKVEKPRSTWLKKDESEAEESRTSGKPKEVEVKASQNETIQNIRSIWATRENGSTAKSDYVRHVKIKVRENKNIQNIRSTWVQRDQENIDCNSRENHSPEVERGDVWQKNDFDGEQEQTGVANDSEGENVYLKRNDNFCCSIIDNKVSPLQNVDHTEFKNIVEGDKTGMIEDGQQIFSTDGQTESVDEAFSHINQIGEVKQHGNSSDEKGKKTIRDPEHGPLHTELYSGDESDCVNPVANPLDENEITDCVKEPHPVLEHITAPVVQRLNENTFDSLAENRQHLPPQDLKYSSGESQNDGYFATWSTKTNDLVEESFDGMNNDFQRSIAYVDTTSEDSNDIPPPPLEYSKTRVSETSIDATWPQSNHHGVSEKDDAQFLQNHPRTEDRLGKSPSTSNFQQTQLSQKSFQSEKEKLKRDQIEIKRHSENSMDKILLSRSSGTKGRTDKEGDLLWSNFTQSEEWSKDDDIDRCRIEETRRDISPNRVRVGEDKRAKTVIVLDIASKSFDRLSADCHFEELEWQKMGNHSQGSGASLKRISSIPNHTSFDSKKHGDQHFESLTVNDFGFFVQDEFMSSLQNFNPNVGLSSKRKLQSKHSLPEDEIDMKFNAVDNSAAFESWSGVGRKQKLQQKDDSLTKRESDDRNAEQWAAFDTAYDATTESYGIFPAEATSPQKTKHFAAKQESKTKTLDDSFDNSNAVAEATIISSPWTQSTDLISTAAENPQMDALVTENQRNELENSSEPVERMKWSMFHAKFEELEEKVYKHIPNDSMITTKTKNEEWREVPQKKKEMRRAADVLEHSIVDLADKPDKKDSSNEINAGFEKSTGLQRKQVEKQTRGMTGTSAKITEKRRPQVEQIGVFSGTEWASFDAKFEKSDQVEQTEENVCFGRFTPREESGGTNSQLQLRDTKFQYFGSSSRSRLLTKDEKKSNSRDRNSNGLVYRPVPIDLIGVNSSMEVPSMTDSTKASQATRQNHRSVCFDSSSHHGKNEQDSHLGELTQIRDKSNITKIKPPSSMSHQEVFQPTQDQALISSEEIYFMNLLRNEDSGSDPSSDLHTLESVNKKINEKNSSFVNGDREIHGRRPITSIQQTEKVVISMCNDRQDLQESALEAIPSSHNDTVSFVPNTDKNCEEVVKSSAAPRNGHEKKSRTDILDGSPVPLKKVNEERRGNERGQQSHFNIGATDLHFMTQPSISTEETTIDLAETEKKFRDYLSTKANDELPEKAWSQDVSSKDLDTLRRGDLDVRNAMDEEKVSYRNDKCKEASTKPIFKRIQEVSSDVDIPQHMGKEISSRTSEVTGNQSETLLNKSENCVSLDDCNSIREHDRGLKDFLEQRQMRSKNHTKNGKTSSEITAETNNRKSDETTNEVDHFAALNEYLSKKQHSHGMDNTNRPVSKILPEMSRKIGEGGNIKDQCDEILGDMEKLSSSLTKMNFVPTPSYRLEKSVDVEKLSSEVSWPSQVKSDRGNSSLSVDEKYEKIVHDVDEATMDFEMTSTSKHRLQNAIHDVDEATLDYEMISRSEHRQDITYDVDEATKDYEMISEDNRPISTLHDVDEVTKNYENMTGEHRNENKDDSSRGRDPYEYNERAFTENSNSKPIDPDLNRSEFIGQDRYHRHKAMRSPIIRILDRPLLDLDDDCEDLDAIELERQNTEFSMAQDPEPAVAEYNNFGMEPPDPCPADPSPEGRRLSSSTPRFTNTTEAPEGATKEEISLLNRFIEVASSDFGGQTLSSESESRVRAAALKVGLTEKFVDQLMEQTIKRSDDGGSNLSFVPTQAQQENQQQHQLQHPQPMHNPSLLNQGSTSYSINQSSSHFSSVPSSLRENGVDNDTYYTDEYSRTEGRSRASHYDDCNVWEGLGKGLAFLANMTAKTCGVNYHRNHRDRNFRDDGGSVVSEISWEDRHSRQYSTQERRSRRSDDRTRRTPEHQPNDLNQLDRTRRVTFDDNVDEQEYDTRVEPVNTGVIYDNTPPRPKITQLV